MVTTVNPTNIRNRALEEMGLLRKGETADSAQAQSLDEAYVELYGELQEDQLTGAFTVTSGVPIQFVRPIVVLIALRRANTWRIPDARYQTIVIEAGADGDRAMGKIRKFVNGRNVSDVISFSDF